MKISDFLIILSFSSAVFGLLQAGFTLIKTILPGENAKIDAVKLQVVSTTYIPADPEVWKKAQKNYRRDYHRFTTLAWVYLAILFLLAGLTYYAGFRFSWNIYAEFFVAFLFFGWLAIFNGRKFHRLKENETQAKHVFFKDVTIEIVGNYDVLFNQIIKILDLLHAKPPELSIVPGTLVAYRGGFFAQTLTVRILAIQTDHFRIELESSSNKNKQFPEEYTKIATPFVRLLLLSSGGVDRPQQKQAPLWLPPSIKP